jgi:glyoxylase-like metal-dependent hydrolase (beta-lactamase superfamily II)
MSPLIFPFQTPPAEGEAIEVAEGILWMRQPLPMKGLDHVNVYAIRDGDGWCIVDTGIYTKRSVAVWEKLISGPLGGLPITRVLITHHHWDHTGMAGWFQKEHGADLLATRVAWMYARMMILDVQDTWPDESIAFYKRAGVPSEIIAQRQAARPFNAGDASHPIPLGFQRIDEGDSIKIGDRTWDVRLGNGHAPDHATLWSQSGDVVIAGDQILPGITPNVSVYPTEPLADPLADWLESCERLRAYATNDQIALPGHKVPFHGIPTRLNQLIDSHHTALDRLEEFLSEPRIATDCFPILFRRKIGSGDFGLALGEAFAHLSHLWQAGRATREIGPDGSYYWQRKNR